MSSGYDKSGGLNVSGDKIFLGNVTFQGGSSGGGGSGLGTVYSTTTSDATPITLKVGTFGTSGGAWNGDIMLMAISSSASITPAISAIFTSSFAGDADGVVMSITLSSSVGGLNIINLTGSNLQAFFDTVASSAGVLSIQAMTGPEFNITASLGANKLSILAFTASVSGASVTTGFGTFQVGQDASSGPASYGFTSFKLSNCLYSCDTSGNTAGSGSAQQKVSSGSPLDPTDSNTMITSSTSGDIRVAIQGIAASTLNWYGYVIGQKVFSI